MKQITLFILFTLLCSGCNFGPKNLDQYMVDVSEFTIENDLLEDGDYVRVLGSSGNLTKEHEIDFYNLIVVKSLSTGDTINVLVTNYFQADLNNPKTMFLSNTSVLGKLMEQINNGENIETNSLEDKNLKSLASKTYDKVFYDTEYIQIDVRKYPAVTGNLGNYKVEGDLKIFDCLIF